MRLRHQNDYVQLLSRKHPSPIGDCGDAIARPLTPEDFKKSSTIASLHGIPASRPIRSAIIACDHAREWGSGLSKKLTNLSIVLCLPIQ